jgi:hypothetical protein
VAAIPFLRNAIFGNAFYAIVFFGGFALAQRRFAGLRETPNLTAERATS